MGLGGRIRLDEAGVEKPRGRLAAWWAPRGMVGGSVAHRNRLWILGGGTYETPNTPDRTFHNDVWSSSDGVHWACHNRNAPWTPRQYHGTAVFDDRM